MKDNHVTNILPEYLDNSLDQDQKIQVEQHLKKCSSCQKELEELSGLFAAFDKEERSYPSEKLKANFYELLEQESLKTTKSLQIPSKSTSGANQGTFHFLKIAASIAIIIGSFLLGKSWEARDAQKEIAVLKTESLEMKQTTMLSLMENQSASRRIQGVHYIDEFVNPDEAIVKALANRMLHDENTNVRLTAVEALGKFTSSETVKNAFIAALQTEKDPSIQITIIHTLVEIQEKKAIAPMQRLLRQEETQPFVKKQIESLLPSII